MTNAELRRIETFQAIEQIIRDLASEGEFVYLFEATWARLALHQIKEHFEPYGYNVGMLGNEIYIDWLPEDDKK